MKIHDSGDFRDGRTAGSATGRDEDERMDNDGHESMSGRAAPGGGEDGGSGSMTRRG